MLAQIGAINNAIMQTMIVSSSLGSISNFIGGTVWYKFHAFPAEKSASLGLPHRDK